MVMIWPSLTFITAKHDDQPGTVRLSILLVVGVGWMLRPDFSFKLNGKLLFKENSERT